ncbi:MAG TPA: HEAT repeat domain-containing protein [Rhodospirillales bacterium]|nr:HEAT repeat domain-containing protein [Rhodospirillales bacterium]
MASSMRQRGQRARIGAPTRRALLALAVVLTLAGPAAAAGVIEVAVQGERMSAQVGSAPIADVLAAVAEQTGARLSVRGTLGNARPQAFSGVPLAEALPRLAQPNGLILRFDDGPVGSRRLLAIHAVAPGSAARSPSVVRTGAQRGQLPPLWSYEQPEKMPDTEQRLETIEQVAKRRGPSPLNAFTDVLIHDPDPAVRMAALGHISGMPGEEARRAVLQSVADPEPEMRMAALRALASGREKPVSVLAQVAKGDSDPAVRSAALGLLTKGDGDLARAVLEGARADPDQQVREAAQKALRR